MVAFILTMPGVASWNGRWSGEGTLYAKLDGTLGKEKEAELVAGSPYHYSWNDGWCARVEVRQVDRNEAARIRRRAKGFCGYDWMVTSIIKKGKIKP